MRANLSHAEADGPNLLTTPKSVVTAILSKAMATLWGESLTILVTKRYLIWDSERSLKEVNSKSRW